MSIFGLVFGIKDNNKETQDKFDDDMDAEFEKFKETCDTVSFESEKFKEIDNTIKKQQEAISRVSSSVRETLGKLRGQLKSLEGVKKHVS